MNQFLLFADEQVEQEKEEQEGVVKLLVVNQLELDEVRVAGMDYLHGNAKEIQKKKRRKSKATLETNTTDCLNRCSRQWGSSEGWWWWSTSWTRLFTILRCLVAAKFDYIQFYWFFIVFLFRCRWTRGGGEPAERSEDSVVGVHNQQPGWGADGAAGTQHGVPGLWTRG